MELKSSFLFFFPISLLLLALLVVSGCGKECEFDADCHISTPSHLRELNPQCFDYSVRCIENACVPSERIHSNCCGNNRCEPGQNKCTCPRDCGPCEGRAEIAITEFTTQETQFLKYACNAQDECVLSLDPADVRRIDMLSEANIMYVGRVELIVNADQPFDVRNSEFRLELSVKDSEREMIFPLNITSIRILDGRDRQAILAQKRIQKSLHYVGDSIVDYIPVSPDILSQLEEDKMITVSVDFANKFRMYEGFDSEGNRIYSDHINRGNHQFFFNQQIMFVKPD